MAELRFSLDWMSVGNDDPVFRDSAARLAIHLDDICLTRNEDAWSKTVRDPVLVSTYPLAMWFASSWWRLNWEPLPVPTPIPSLEWRMAHELGAANHGFVWPRILFAPDGEAMNVWAEAAGTIGQSVRYLSGLNGPQALKISDFQRSIDVFIGDVLSRLAAMGHEESDLARLWKLVCEDRADPQASLTRRLEAQMGFEPEECPEAIMKEAQDLQTQTGVEAMSELAPVFGRREDGVALGEIAALGAAEGIRGRLQVKTDEFATKPTTIAPWRRGVDMAKRLRAHLGNANNPINNATLFDLLGIAKDQGENWTIEGNRPVAVARPVAGDLLNFLPRKRHPVARRFEFARLLGDCLSEASKSGNWLVSSDLATARQKRQRAFAAEFLCPIEALAGFLHNDYSESAIEDAAEHFGVSERTVESLLANNGYVPALIEPPVPYRLAA